MINKYSAPAIAQHMAQVAKNTPAKLIKYQEIAQRYLDTTHDMMLEAVTTYRNPEGVFISMDNLRDKIYDKYSVNKKQVYWLDWLIKNYPLFATQRRGYKAGTTGRLTLIIPLVKIMRSPERLYKEEVTDLAIESGQIEPDQIPIDISSLSGYILNCQNIIDAATTRDAYVNKLSKNCTIASELLALVEKTTEVHKFTTPTLLQYPRESDSGRTYYLGNLSMTSMPSEVREAALGPCYKYDLQCAVFGFYTYALKRMLNARQLRGSLVEEYVHNRAAIRTRLAHVINNTEAPLTSRVKWIKQALTAMSFGADWGNTWFNPTRGDFESNGISQYIKNKADQAALMNDSWFRLFKQELDEITTAVYKNMSPEELNYYQEKTDQRLSKSRVLAFYYQAFETHVITQMIAAGTTPNNVIMRLHDGFYTKKPIKQSAVTDLCMDNGWPRLEVSDVGSYKQYIDYKETVARHQAHLEQEEAAAQQYYTAKLAEPKDTKKQQAHELFSHYGVEYVVGNIHKFIEIRDVGQYVTDWIIQSQQAVPA